MSKDNLVFHKVAEDISEITFGDNRIAVVEIEGKKVCLAQHHNDYFAFAYKCPHAGGILAMGHLDPMGNVVCPLHRYKFSISNGRNISGEGYYLKHWPVELREDGVYVAQDHKSFFGLF